MRDIRPLAQNLENFGSRSRAVPQAPGATKCRSGPCTRRFRVYAARGLGYVGENPSSDRPGSSECGKTRAAGARRRSFHEHHMPLRFHRVRRNQSAEPSGHGHDAPLSRFTSRAGHLAPGRHGRGRGHCGGCRAVRGLSAHVRPWRRQFLADLRRVRRRAQGPQRQRPGRHPPPRRKHMPCGASKPCPSAAIWP